MLHDIRFVEDDWESPTLGAWGLGWEVWCDGMEIGQFTYFQQVGGIPVAVPSFEMTYGLERMAMYVQGVERVYDLDFNGAGVTYGDVFLRNEREYSQYSFEHGNVAMLTPAVRRRRSGMRPADRRSAWRCRPTTSASRRATCSTCWTRAAPSR